MFWASSFLPQSGKGATDGILTASFREFTGSCLRQAGRELVAQSVDFVLFALQKAQSRPKSLAGVLVATGFEQTVD